MLSAGIPDELHDIDGRNYLKAFKATPIQCSEGNGKEKLEALMEDWGEGCQAIIEIWYRNRPGGHAFVAEYLDDGIAYLDPQTGAYDVGFYFDRAREGQTVIMRVDNAPSTDLIKRLVRVER